MISSRLKRLYERVELKEKELREYSILFKHIRQELHRALTEFELLKSKADNIERIIVGILSEEFLHKATRDCTNYLVKLYEEFEIDEDELQNLMDNLKRLLRTEIRELFKELIKIREQLGIKPPLMGKPLGYVIEDVIRVNIPKAPPRREQKEYGILDLTKKPFIQEKLKKFVKKHKRGVIIMDKDIKEKVLETLSPPEIEVHYNTYSDSLIQKLILTFQWRR